MQRTLIALAKTASKERAALAKLIDNRNQQIEVIALDLHNSAKNTSERPHA